MIDRKDRAGLLGAVAAGTAAELSAVALTASAAWLIARAAQQPPLSALALAIVGVRAFALFRGALRYTERLTGHDAALRTLANLRVRVYEALHLERAWRRASGCETRIWCNGWWPTSSRCRICCCAACCPRRSPGWWG